MSGHPKIDFHVGDEWNARTQEIHERFTHTAIDEFADRMPDVTYPGVNEAAHLVITPKYTEYDPTEAITYVYPFANGNALHLGIRAMFLADITGQQVVAFPNNTVGETYYSLSDEQRRMVADGNFAPLADKFLATVLGSPSQPSGIEQLSIAGYSFGGVMAASMYASTRAHEQAKTIAVSVQEPANVLTRTPGQLRKAFMASGMDDVYDAARSSGIPALYEAIRPSRVAGFVSLVKFALGTQIKPNHDLNGGMTHSQLFEDLGDGLDQSPDTVVQIVGASGSSIFPYQHAVLLATLLKENHRTAQIDPVYFEGTHALGDSVINPMLAIRRAIGLATAA